MKRFDAIHPAPVSQEQRTASLKAKFSRDPVVVANESFFDTLTPPISIPKPRPLRPGEQPYPVGVSYSDRVEREVTVRCGPLRAHSDASGNSAT